MKKAILFLAIIIFLCLGYYFYVNHVIQPKNVYFSIDKPSSIDVLTVGKPFEIEWQVKGILVGQSVPVDILEFRVINGNRDGGHLIASGVSGTHFSWIPSVSVQEDQVGVRQARDNGQGYPNPTAFSSIFSVLAQ